jgi:rfaE bifunctional protein nucleotidyltransferase chain/domain
VATAGEPRFSAKIARLEEFAARAAALPRPLVFTNGVFDILHRGHVTYLDRAAALGASLIVGVNSDSSVRRLGKGDDRPINAEADRMAVVAALEAVSLVVPFVDDTPLALILACRPDVLVKGGDWAPEKIVGAAEVRGWGGRVVAIPFEHERSTTSLLSRIRRPS